MRRLNFEFCTARLLNAGRSKTPAHSFFIAAGVHPRLKFAARATKKPRGSIPWASSSSRFNSGTRLTAQSSAGWPPGNRAGREWCSTGRSLAHRAGQPVRLVEQPLPDVRSPCLGSASKANDSFRSSSQLDRSRPVRTVLDRIRKSRLGSRWRRTRRCSVRNSCSLFRKCRSSYDHTNNSRLQPRQTVQPKRQTTNSAWCLDSFSYMTGAQPTRFVGGKSTRVSPSELCRHAPPLAPDTLYSDYRTS
jgi:hypothetical protein